MGEGVTPLADCPTCRLLDGPGGSSVEKFRRTTEVFLGTLRVTKTLEVFQMNGRPAETAASTQA